MKHEWRKHEKEIYIPKKIPVQITLPPLNYFMIKGKGNPNDPSFAEYVGVLYSLSYGVRMSIKKGIAPDDYNEYTVYPLEGIWDISDKAKQENSGVLDKDELVFNLMIRQPEFVTEEFASLIIDRTREKKPNPLLDNITFGPIDEGRCVQMMHVGSYDNEPKSFKIMEYYCQENKLERVSKKHHEVYLSDFRKVAPEKLKTILRFQVI